MMAGCIAAGIYSTNLPEACHYISDHSKAGIIAVEDNKQLQKYSSLLSDPKKQLPFLKAIIVWGEPIDPKIKCGNVKIYSWNDFLALGTTVQDSSIETRLSKILPGNCSTLIYTSGTTGNPKAVMISHDNVTWTAMVMGSQYMHFDHNERSVSYLPLSHIAAQILDIHVPMFLGSTLYFCQPDALKGSLTVTLTDVKPTFFFGVPRVWEKVQETMVQKGREVSGVLRMIATWAKGCAAEKNRLRQVGEKGGFLKLGYVIGFIVAFAFYQTFLSTLVEVSAQYPLISVISKLDDVTVFAVSVVLSFIVNFSTEISYFVASKVILSKIHEKVGLNKCKACFTAAAPISVDTLSYFASIDIPVFEVFGQSECTGPHTVSAPGQWRIGYCGRPMPGTESMIAKDTNELCYRGRHIMMGYMYMRDKTDEAIDADGYLHSGDVAEFDENEQKGFTGPSGFMRITGRIKELIITAGGENIPPVLIENEMKAAMNAISNCMVIGDKKKFLTILISLKTEVDKETGVPTDKLAADSLHAGKQIGSKATTISEAAKDPVWDKYLTDGIKVANSKTTSQAQIVQKYKLLPVDFSEKGGELTPTLKLKRNIATEKYKDLIESMYAE
jgi:long-chain-fatty-acid--CoA ligase ACSBG